MRQRGRSREYRVPRGTLRRRAAPSRYPSALLAMFALLLLIAGCSAIPSSGPVQDVRKVTDRSDVAAPPGPEPGQQPEQIVREFIHASAMTEYDTAGESFVVARQFLSASAAERWHVDAVSSPVVVLADDFAAIPDPENAGSVTVRGRQIGALAADRSYRPIDEAEYSVTMHLERSDGEWQITDPPADILIARNDFMTAFRGRTVYFLDSSGRVVVPDLRYLPNVSIPDLTANRLMELLLAGPSRQLAGAARTQLGPGVQLQSNVHIDNDGVAHVDLGEVDIATPAAAQALAAQIVWTLDPDVNLVAITANGLPLSEVGPGGTSGGGTGTTPSAQATPDAASSIYSLASGTVANFSPDVVPGSAQAVSDAYYVDHGAILRVSDGTPMWGSVGTGSVDVQSAAISAASGALAAVVRDVDGGQQLLVGRPFDHQPVVTALKAATLTKPSFTRWGYAAWTVQNGATHPEVYEVSTTDGAPTWSRVSAPGLADLGEVTALALSPDGVRVAVVADHTLYMGVIMPAPDRAPGNGGAGAGSGSVDHRGLELARLTPLRSDLTDVGPVAWEDSVNLLVGARMARSAHRTVFEVSIDGQSVDAITTAQSIGDVFDDVDAIASSTSGLPLLISFGGRIWQLQGSPTSGQWVPPDGGNWMPGSAPFYPN